jgi:DNA-directed RNA polymerase subunit RPC12/RpoP
VGLLSNLFGGQTVECPECGKPMKEVPGEAGRFECRDFSCPSPPYYLEDGELVDVQTRNRALYSGGSGGYGDCAFCRNSFAGGISYSPYEDGSNEDAYIICPSCGEKNYQ